jgi:hypothetical protein
MVLALVISNQRVLLWGKFESLNSTTPEEHGLEGGTFLIACLQAASRLQKLDPPKQTFFQPPKHLCRQPPQHPKNGVDTCKFAA